MKKRPQEQEAMSKSWYRLEHQGTTSIGSPGESGQTIAGYRASVRIYSGEKSVDGFKADFVVAGMNYNSVDFVELVKTSLLATQ